MKLGWIGLAICCQLMLFSILPGRAAADNGQSPSLQLLQQQHVPGQNVQPDVPATLRDIHGPINLPEPVPYLLYSLLGLAALVLFLALYWWFFRRSKPAPLPIPPEVAARSELIRARELMNPGQALHYMERLSEILRHYLEAKFGLPTTRQTTREFFRTMSVEPPKTLALAGFTVELKGCLERCDMAKFAHQGADVAQLQELEDSILQFVNSTVHTGNQDQTGGGR